MLPPAWPTLPSTLAPLSLLLAKPVSLKPPSPVKSSWSKADSRGGPKRFLENCSSDCSFSAQLWTKRTGGMGSVFPVPPPHSGPLHRLF